MRPGERARPRGWRPSVEWSNPGNREAPSALSADQQRAIGLRTARVTLGDVLRRADRPGAGRPERDPVRLHHAAGRRGRPLGHGPRRPGRQGGRPAGDDRQPGVGEARLELYTRLQALEIAKAQADWQETIYRNTLDLVERSSKGETPEQIHDGFADRAVGENREQLMTAYAQYRLAVATIERNRELYAQKLITPKQFQQVNADYEVAQATYQSLMDQMGYDSAAGEHPGRSRPGSRRRPRSGPPRSGCGSSASSPTAPSPRSSRARSSGSSRTGRSRAAGRAPRPSPRSPRRSSRRRSERVKRPSSRSGARRRRDGAGRRPRQHLLDLGPVRRHDPRPRDDRARGRRRHDAPDLHAGQPLDGLGRGERPRERLRHARRAAADARSGSGRRPTPAACSRAR